jgi:NAD(P)-dependent dehydrogenase (short-subunit alcohol dehydrogenase family)
MAGRLENRVAIVIGAGSIGPGWGNGKASAVLFAREGAKVFAVDLSGDAAEETVSVIRSEGGDAVAHQADASRAAEVERLVAACVERWGRIDVLHHNVGIVRLGGPVELTLEAWNRALEVNLTSAFLTCKYVLPVMERQGRGAIVTTGSIAGIRWTGVPYVSYSATKAAIAQLTQSVALQYASKGIRANCIEPGLMNTPMIREGLPKAYAAGDVEKMIEVREKQCPTGHMGDAWDVANAALFLASDDARYITGTTLVVDGGITVSSRTT